MVGRTRGSTQRRYRADESLSWSPERKPILGRGSPSPTTPRFRRGPPSPGIRPHRHRSPSPMGLSSPDPADFSSSEEVEPSEATVTSSELDDQLDLEDARVISSHGLDLSPILEVDGLPEASISSGSRSPPFSPAAAALFCRGSGDFRGVDLVSSVSSSLLGDVDRGRRGAVEVGEAALVLGNGEDEGAEGGAVPIGGGHLMTLGDVPGSSSDSFDEARLPSMVSSGVHQIASEKVTGDFSNSTVCLPIAHSSEDLDFVNSRLVKEHHRAVTPQPGIARPVAVSPHSGDTLPGAELSEFGPIPPLCGGTVGQGDGGSVSEEVRVASVAREALRSQSTDGLRQPPLSPAVPEGGAEGGVGMDGIFGGRSFAHVVQTDRRADVELREELLGTAPLLAAYRCSSAIPGYMPKLLDGRAPSMLTELQCCYWLKLPIGAALMLTLMGSPQIELPTCSVMHSWLGEGYWLPFFMLVA
ncbi:hypothetical protein Dimus_029172 [Dionaea muscipula]